MASQYKRHSTGGRFKQRSASDLGSGAIKAQADVVVNSLKLQQARSSEYASDYVQGMKGVEQTEEWNQNLLSDLEDKIYQNKREAIKVRQKREVESLQGKAKEYGKQAEFWKDFSTTYSKQWGKLAEGAVDLGLRAAADKELDKLRDDEFFKAFDDQEKLTEVVEKLLSKEFDANSKDPKSLNTLSKLFNSQNKYLRAGTLRELKTQLPAIELSIKDTIVNNPDLEWSASTIQDHYTTFGKNLIKKFDLGNSKEGRELLQIFNKYGHLKAQYQRNADDVKADSDNINLSIGAYKYYKNSSDPNEFHLKILRQNLFHAVGSAKRKSGDGFVVGYDNPKANLIAVAEVLAPHSPGEAKDFVDDILGFPTPGNSDVDFNKRNKEPLTNAELRTDIAKIHKDVWDKHQKDAAAEQKVVDLTARDAFRDSLDDPDTPKPGTEGWIKWLEVQSNENSGNVLTEEEISKARLFNFPAKNGLMINDFLVKAEADGDLALMNDIVRYLPPDYRAEWEEVRQDLALQKTVTDDTRLRNYGKEIINDIAGKENINPKRSNATKDVEHAWRQTYQLHWKSTRGKDSAIARHSLAKEYADNAAKTNAGLFRRGKTLSGNITWLAFETDDIVDTDAGRKVSDFGKGLSKNNLSNYIKEHGVNGLLNDPKVGARDNQGVADEGAFNPMPLNYYDDVSKAQAANRDIPIHENLELIYRSQTGPYKLTRTELLNHFRDAGLKSKTPMQLSLSNLPPGMTDKIQYDIESSRMNFPDYHWYPVRDQIATGVLANLLKDPESKVQDYYDKDLIEAMSSAELSGIDPVDYINQPKYDPFKIFSNVIGGK